MTATEIAKSLFDGSICPEEAKANIMREYEIDCQRAVKRWAYQWDTIRLCGRRLVTTPPYEYGGFSSNALPYISTR